MCTVSFVVANEQIIITSNRDESVGRPSALKPEKYLVNNKNIIFPKDPKAGGTWFATTENGTVVVLLNGAKEKHQVKDSYRRSRGLILLDIISSNAPLEHWKNIDLMNIEPFTVVLYLNKELYQLQWNEIEKEIVQLDQSMHHIWSSSTLYSSEVRLQRVHWFEKFMNEQQELNPLNLFDFHQNTASGNKDFGLIINRNNSLKTLSITQAVVKKNEIEFSHLDLQHQKHFVNSYSIQ
jgi:uncharacterized protein with NRDE domain